MRERIEWCDIWVTGANANDLPRVLLVGDSITRSYFATVDQMLGERFACARLATSKCICDPSFQKELRLVLEDYAFEVIHFNNGLHGWAYDEDAYAQSFPDTMHFIRDLAPDSNVIWASTTPVWNKERPNVLDARTQRVQERNRIAQAFADAHQIPINDLFGLVVDHPELFSKDGVHFNPEGQRVLGERVAQVILDQGQPSG